MSVTRPRIVSAGSNCLTAARRLASVPADVTLIEGIPPQEKTG